MLFDLLDPVHTLTLKIFLDIKVAFTKIIGETYFQRKTLCSNKHAAFVCLP